MRVLIYSANIGGYDHRHAHSEQSIPVEFQYFDQPQFGLSSMMEAKWYKMHPPEGYDYTIWVDSSVRIKSPHFAKWCVDAAKDKWAIFRHPNRQCAYAEAEFAQDMKKYYDCPIREQMSSYRAEGFPENYGLWACTMIARSNWGKEINEAWWTENQKWSFQDQVSLPYVLWKQSETIYDLPCSFPSNMVQINSGHRGEGYKVCPR